jgi:hypothetical protein
VKNSLLENGILPKSILLMDLTTQTKLNQSALLLASDGSPLKDYCSQFNLKKLLIIVDLVSTLLKMFSKNILISFMNLARLQLLESALS